MGVVGDINKLVKKAQAFVKFYPDDVYREGANNIVNVAKKVPNAAWGVLGVGAGLAKGVADRVGKGQPEGSWGDYVRAGWDAGYNDGDIAAAGLIEGMANGIPFANFEAPSRFADFVQKQKVDGGMKSEIADTMRTRANYAGYGVDLAAGGAIGKAIGAGGAAGRAIGAARGAVGRTAAPLTQANRWVFTKMMGPTVGPRVARWSPWVSGGSFAARTADGALGLTHIEPSDSAAMQGVKRLTRDYILPAGQLLNPAGAGAYVLGNGMADAAFRPAIRETTASLIKPEDVEKFMEDLSQSNPQGWAGLMLGGLSMAGDRFDKKVKNLALPSKVVYNQLRKLYPQLPEDADMEGIREGYDKAIRDFRTNIANNLERSDSTIGKSVGKMFNSNPRYFNDLLDRLSSGDYSKSITSRLGADPFFGTSAAWEGIQDSTKKFLLDYASKKLDENPEAVAALGLGLSNVGRKVYAGGKAINDRIEEHNKRVKQEMPNGQAKPHPSQVGAPVEE